MSTVVSSAMPAGAYVGLQARPSLFVQVELGLAVLMPDQKG